MLAELCLPLVRVGGYWVAPKGPDPEAEVEAGRAAIAALGGDVSRLRIEQSEVAGPEFTVLTVRKAASTPSAYPRNANQMKKKPLG